MLIARALGMTVNEHWTKAELIQNMKFYRYESNVRRIKVG